MWLKKFRRWCQGPPIRVLETHQGHYVKHGRKFLDPNGDVWYRPTQYSCMTKEKATQVAETWEKLLYD
jgi:hypothetical protein